jgi:RNA polymerase sigma-70 factor (ECF subfamily)
VTDTTLLDTLWRAHARELRRFAVSRGATWWQADDVVAEAFSRLAAKPAPADGRAWLFAIVRNQLVDGHRAVRRERPVAVVPDAPEPLTDGDGDGLRERYSGCIRRLVDELPAASRAALLAVDADGRTHRSVAESAGISVPGIKSRVQRARKHVLSLLESCCSLVRDARGTVVALDPVDSVAGCRCSC